MAIRLALFLFIRSCFCTDCPLIIIDPTGRICPQTAGNPFLRMPSDAFSDVIRDAIAKSEHILVFVEDRLSVEDLASRDADGTPYPNIRAMFLDGRAKYLSKVNEPLAVMRKRIPTNDSKVMRLTNNDDVVLDKDTKYYFIYFLEPADFIEETRVERLRRHDFFIKQAYSSMSLEATRPVTAFYTGKHNPTRNVDHTYRRPSQRQRQSETIMMTTSQALIRLTGVTLQQGSTRTQLTEPQASARSFAQRRASTRVMYEDELELDFNFEYQQDDWLLDSIVLLEGGEEVGRTSMGVGAPYGYSYFCAEPVYIMNSRDNSYITISKYQVQPRDLDELQISGSDTNFLRVTNDSLLDLLKNKLDQKKKDTLKAILDDALDKLHKLNKSPNSTQIDATKAEIVAKIKDKLGLQLSDVEKKALGKEVDKSFQTFSEAHTCGTNFNCRILAGLFVASIVIGIAFCGIIAMMDCSSNDRMDDPNQKPLVIVAQI